MSLIICSECGKEFSDRANTCPNCGNPLANQENNFLEEGHAITIQRTYKRWKLVKLFSWITIVIGLLSLPNGETGMALGGMLIFFGVIGLIIGKLGAWWTTG
jgi:uncharacterized OB-fold protein